MVLIYVVAFYDCLAIVPPLPYVYFFVLSNCTANNVNLLPVVVNIFQEMMANNAIDQRESIMAIVSSKVMHRTTTATTYTQYNIY